MADPLFSPQSYAKTCVASVDCQEQIANVDSASSNVFIYSLSTVGTTFQLSVDGAGVINQADNINGLASTVTAWALSSNPLQASAPAPAARVRDMSRWLPRGRMSFAL